MNSKSLQVIRTLLSILANLNNALVWIVLIWPPISNSSRPSFQVFVNCSSCSNYNSYHYYPHIPQPSYFSGKLLVLVSHFAFLDFHCRLLIILFFIHWEFFTSVLAGSHLQESEKQQVSLNLQDSSQYSGCSQQCLFWIVSTRPFISKSSSPFNNSLVTAPRVTITIDITVTFMFHSFFNSLARSRYLSFFLLYFSFTQWSAATTKSTIHQVVFFFFSFNYFEVWSSGRD